MATKKEDTQVVTTDADVTAKPAMSATEMWQKNSKLITIIGVVIIAGLLAWIGYKKFIVEPNEKTAAEMIYPAEGLFDKMAATGFSKDSVAIILNGGTPGGVPVTGLLKIVKQYSGTEAANRANYMIGASYLQIKEFDKAITYLKDFKGNGADQVQSRAYMMLGHAYAEKKSTGEAMDYYKKAASVNSKDEVFAADALLTAAAYAGTLGKNDDAVKLYKEVQTKYPTNMAVQNGEIDKQLAKLGVTE